MKTFLSYPLSYVASYKFSFWQVSLDCEKEGENPPSGHERVDVWRQTQLVRTYLAAVGISSHLVPSAPLRGHSSDCCRGRADALARTHSYVCSTYDVMGPCSRPLGTTIILALLSHNNNKSTCFMRTFLSALEKASLLERECKAFWLKNSWWTSREVPETRGQVLRWHNLA